ncbi:MAG: carbohydrate-binding domain-containing protein [Ruminococcus sp.]|nr:carbohydrate-binding domain-containing protein [Ruminococcus sp.]
MNYKKIFAAIISMTMIAGAASCGQIKSSSEKSSEKSAGDTNIASTELDENASSSEDTTSGEDETDVTDKDAKGTTAAKDSSDNKTTTTTASNGSSSSSGTSASQDGNSSGSSSSSSENDSSGSGDSSAQSQPSGGNSSSGQTSSGGSSSGGNSSGGSSSGGQTQQDPDNNTSEEKVYTAEVTLGSSPKVTGENVTVSGSVATITAGGDYRFSGKVSEGQICVNTATEDHVTVVLDGVDISNSSGPAIFVYEAKKCTIKVREGTTNNLSGGVKDKGKNGVICSNDTLRFKGNGTLNITTNNSHGISSDDDIIVENGIYNINSDKSGLIANDDITINGGTININGGTNGIKSKGTLNINGGSTIVSGGTKEEKSSVYAAGTFNYTDGYLFAAGNQVSPPTYSDNPFIIVDLGESVSSGSSVEMLLNGKKMVSFAPHNNFRCLMMLAPEISSGSSFNTVINGSKSDTKTVENGQNLFSTK